MTSTNFDHEFRHLTHLVRNSTSTSLPLSFSRVFWSSDSGLLGRFARGCTSVQCICIIYASFKIWEIIKAGASRIGRSSYRGMSVGNIISAWLFISDYHFLWVSDLLRMSSCVSFIGAVIWVAITVYLCTWSSWSVRRYLKKKRWETLAANFEFSGHFPLTPTPLKEFSPLPLLLLFALSFSLLFPLSFPLVMLALLSIVLPFSSPWRSPLILWLSLACPPSLSRSNSSSMIPYRDNKVKRATPLKVSKASKLHFQGSRPPHLPVCTCFRCYFGRDSSGWRFWSRLPSLYRLWKGYFLDAAAVAAKKLALATIQPEGSEREKMMTQDQTLGLSGERLSGQLTGCCLELLWTLPTSCTGSFSRWDWRSFSACMLFTLLKEGAGPGYRWYSLPSTPRIGGVYIGIPHISVTWRAAPAMMQGRVILNSIIGGCCVEL